MPKNASRLAATALAMLLSAATFAETREEALDQTLVKIDDFSLTALHFALFASQTGREPEDPEGQIRLLNELVNNFMVANSPQGRALETHPEIAAALEVARARLIAQTFIRSELEKNPVEDAQIQAMYDAEYGKTPRTEYKARHILVDSEEAAQALIGELNGGADFAKLAGERSIGPSKSVGGDLGWFGADEMVAEFSAATAKLSDGAYSKAPVKTQFGWHVILREESREVPPPALEAVREELKQQIQQEQLAKIISGIREKTRIEAQRLD